MMVLFADLWRANQIPNEGSSSSKRATLENKLEDFWFGAGSGKEREEKSLSKRGFFLIHLLTMVSNKI